MRVSASSLTSRATTTSVGSSTGLLWLLAVSSGKAHRLHLVGLEQRVADLVALGGQEGEAHAAHDQAVDPAEELSSTASLSEPCCPRARRERRSRSSSSRDSTLTSLASR